MAAQTYESGSAVTASTTAIAACFMAKMMLAAIGISIEKALDLGIAQFGAQVRGRAAAGPQ